MLSKMTKVGVMLAFAMAAVACSAAAPEGPEPGEPTNENEGEAKLFCGGIAGFPCPEGYVCVDDPTDSCDPKNGGADCGGVCRRGGKPGSKCNYGDPSKSWVSKDANECMLVKFMCAEGQTPFFNECGCGCEEGTPCGSNTCGAGQVCCNASCGICTEPGGFCIQLACEPTN